MEQREYKYGDITRDSSSVKHGISATMALYFAFLFLWALSCINDLSLIGAISLLGSPIGFLLCLKDTLS